MKRVVVTGLGVVSSIGNNQAEVIDSLRQGRSGFVRAESYAEMGLRSQVHGEVRLDTADFIDRKTLRFMGDAAAYTYIAMQQAIGDAGLEAGEVSSPRAGLIVGSGGAATSELVIAADTLRSKGVRKIGPYGVTRTMSSTTSACVGTAFGIKGQSYSISSACATSAHCIGHAAELIQLGKQDIVFAGGGEELHWSMSALFDAMGALSSKYNDTPARASRPFDADRDGFVIAGGGGILVLEEYQHAKARGARIYAELIGYGATSDGADMVQPSGEGAARCMRQALGGLWGQPVETPIDYINCHGTGTPVGDVKELGAIREVFGESPLAHIASTKSLTGHSLGAAGVHEAIFCLLMQREGFIAASANIDHLDPAAEGLPIVRSRIDGARLDTVMSNSFGFGGANASLIFRRL